MNDKLVDLLNDLHAARRGEEYAKATMLGEIEKAKATPQYVGAAEAAANCDADIARYKQAIEALCLPQFAMDANKHPHEAVTIKEFEVVSSYDEKAAREWCFTNFHPALKLDAKVFEKAAKDGNIPNNLAPVTKEARVQIATDLTKYIS